MSATRNILFRMRIKHLFISERSLFQIGRVVVSPRGLFAGLAHDIRVYHFIVYMRRRRRRCTVPADDSAHWRVCVSMHRCVKPRALLPCVCFINSRRPSGALDYCKRCHRSVHFLTHSFDSLRFMVISRFH